MKTHSIYLKVAFSLALLTLSTCFIYQKFYPNNLKNSGFAENTADKEAEKQLQIERLQAEFKMLRDPATNTIPKKAVFEAFQAAEREREASLRSGSGTLPTIGIDARGPSNYGGRCRSLDFDTRNVNIGIAGGVSGGIFRTTNNGDSWTPVTPAGQIHNLTCVAQDKSTGNEDTWYAGSGEQLGNSADGTEAAYYGNGVWKSMDNGMTWSLLGSTTGTLETFDTDWDYVHRILVDPTNRNVYAGNAGGVYRSINQGDNWEQVLPAPNPASETITEIIRTTDGVFYAAISGEGIWKSDNGNSGSWTQIANSTTFGTTLGRIVLNFAPNATHLIYALFVGDDFTCGAATSSVYLRRWDNSANTGAGAWTGNYDNDISDCGVPDLTLDPQGGYNLCIAVRPNNANELFIGGERLYRFTVTGANSGTYVFAGGDQGSPTATNIHVDHHLLLFTDNNTLWSTNDGGMRSTNVSNAPDPNEGFSWTSKTQGLVTYQFYRGDISPTNGSNLVGGGAQDNANNIIPNGTTNGIEVGGGDGIQFALMGGTNSSDFQAIISVQNGTVERANSSGETYISPNEQQYQGFLTFFLLDGDNTEHLYFPANVEFTPTNKSQMFRTRVASTVENTVTGNSATGWELLDLNNIGDNEDITAMGLSRNTSFGGSAYTASTADRKLYIGTDFGKVYRVSDPAFASPLNLIDISPNGAADSYISDIAVHPNDDKELLVTVSNYNVSSIFHTVDATASPVVWTEVEGGAATAVAKASIRSAMITSAGAATLYVVGTSTGLYGTTMMNGNSTTWERIGANEIAYAVCVDMRLRTSDNKIGLATHGNGIFILSPSGDAGGCSISAITAGSQSACDDNTNTYTQDLAITYDGAPGTGSLVVNGQNFAIGASPQTITLTNLTADGQSVNVTAHFSANPACTFTQNNAFTAPTACQVASCNTENSTDTPVNIVDLETRTSTINVSFSGTITDVNVKNLQGTHGYLEDLTVILQSPTGTTVTLFDAICGDNAEGFDISFDDDAVNSLNCPISDAQTEQPQGNLSDFNGEEAIGAWTLSITDGFDGDDGQLTSWMLELCGTFNGGGNCSNPPPATGTIPANTYQVNGDITSAGTVASPTTVIFKASNSITLDNNFEVELGATFEAVIEACNPFVGEEEYVWEMDVEDNNTSNLGNQLQIYPNPFNNETTIAYQLDHPSEVLVSIVDINGKELTRLVQTKTHLDGKHEVIFDADNYQAGIYFVLFKTEKEVQSERLVLVK